MKNVLLAGCALFLITGSVEALKEGEMIKIKIICPNKKPPALVGTMSASFNAQLYQTKLDKDGTMPIPAKWIGQTGNVYTTGFVLDGYCENTCQRFRPCSEHDLDCRPGQRRVCIDNNHLSSGTFKLNGPGQTVMIR